MTIVDIPDGEARFSELVERARSGEEIVIAKAGEPLARLVPMALRPARREPGSARGLGSVRADFDDPMPEDFLKHFD